MKRLNKLKSLLTILTVSGYCLIFLASCRNKLPAFDICVTLEQPGFFCAQQGVPLKEKGYEKSYIPNMICMEATQFNKVIDEISKRDSSLAQYKWGKK